MSIKDFFKQFSDGFKSQSKNVIEETSNGSKVLGDLGIEKLKSVIMEVTAAFPIFERAGYNIEEVQIEIGLVPKLMPRFKLVREIPVQDQQQLLDETKNKKLIKFILISLFKSTKMQNLIQDPKLEFDAIEIDLTAVPSVRGIFRSIKNSEKIVRLSSHDPH